MSVVHCLYSSIQFSLSSWLYSFHLLMTCFMLSWCTLKTTWSLVFIESLISLMFTCCVLKWSHDHQAPRIKKWKTNLSKWVTINWFLFLQPPACSTCLMLEWWNGCSGALCVPLRRRTEALPSPLPRPLLCGPR